MVRTYRFENGSTPTDTTPVKEYRGITRTAELVDGTWVITWTEG